MGNDVCRGNYVGHKAELAEYAAQTEHSKAIDRELMAPPPRLIQKLILLGPGESGKSTVLKQMQILHASGFSDAEVEERKAIVYSNTVRSMLDICQAMTDLKISLNNPNLEREILLLQKHVDDGQEFKGIPPPVKVAIQKLWEDAGVLECFEQRANYQVIDSAAYFFDHIARIAEPYYRPDNKDILLTRVHTTGVVKLSFTLRDIDFNVYDVGGQRSERRKWIHCFDDVNSIIFVAGISEFDQTIREDNSTNRLVEALELFDSISGSRFFVKSSMILFLNKIDLFKKKIKQVSLTVTFPSYKGGMNYDDGVAFLRRSFQRLSRNPDKLYIHETCGTDTKQLEQVFASVIDMVVQGNLKDSGMM